MSSLNYSHSEDQIVPLVFAAGNGKDKRQHLRRNQLANHNRDKLWNKRRKKEHKPKAKTVARERQRQAKWDVVEQEIAKRETDMPPSTCTWCGRIWLPEKWRCLLYYGVEFYKDANAGCTDQCRRISRLACIYGRRCEARLVAGDGLKEELQGLRSKFLQRRQRKLLTVLALHIQSGDCARLVLSYMGCLANCDDGYLPNSDRLQLVIRLGYLRPDEDAVCGFCNANGWPEDSNSDIHHASDFDTECDHDE